ncbi:hypothetical protein HYT55_04855 [Candidatus Woesearchaeota archaeon]|nr:hypothetical protein [Candidatus Woesearchaeota archaeon]
MTVKEENLDLNKAKGERDRWAKKATYWHNALPIFNGIRGTLTEDVQTVTGIEQLELNKSLSRSIRWSNYTNIILGIINLTLFAINIFWLKK